MGRRLLRNIFILILLSACGQGLKNNVDPASTALGEPLTEASSLKGSDKDTAIRICLAYRSKRVKYRSNFVNNSSMFVFNVSETNCANEVTNNSLSTTLVGTLLSSPMIFDTATVGTQFQNTVHTDTQGVLGGICPNLLSGDDVMNSVNWNGKDYVVQFSADGGDSFTLLYGEGSGEEGPVITESMSFFVNTTDNGDHYGHTSIISAFTQCAEGSANEQTSFSQTSTTLP
jgi:hypothetical protein